MGLFTLFYTLLSILIYIILLPFVIFKSQNKKYKEALPSRFFLKKNAPFDKEGIWFHCCSFGETKAIKTITDKLEEPVNISVITNTGYEEACKITKSVRYLPFEFFLPFWVNKQKLLVVMEAELWYMMFLSAKNKQVPTMLINARISDRSYKSYQRFAWFYKYVFANIDTVFAQSQLDKERLEQLGAKNVKAVGNIKLSLLPKISKEYNKPDCFVVTAGSTHENEEQLILDAYNAQWEKLIIVPRHPERFEKVHGLLSNFAQEKDLKYNRFSQEANFDADVVLLDVMGELNNIYAISDVVILGGAFEKIGGHNPVEPAFFNCAIISGENYFNQKPLFECIYDYTIVKNHELKDAMKDVKSLKAASLKEIGDISPIIEEIKNVIR